VNARIELNNFDFAVFAAYIVVIVAIGFIAGRKGRRDSKDYFLGDKKLPWYVVGTSMVATVVSTEHFVAQVGAGYSQGVVIAAFGWNAWLVYKLLIWIFLPYSMRTGLYTMPEFLERRYNPACRYIFAAFAGALYAGGIALEISTNFDALLRDQPAALGHQIVVSSEVAGAAHGAEILRTDGRLHAGGYTWAAGV
jgi:solute:Na+ symporter, SSS family